MLINLIGFEKLTRTTKNMELIKWTSIMNLLELTISISVSFYLGLCDLCFYNLLHWIVHNYFWITTGDVGGHDIILQTLLLRKFRHSSSDLSEIFDVGIEKRSCFWAKPTKRIARISSNVWLSLIFFSKINVLGLKELLLFRTSKYEGKV